MGYALNEAIAAMEFEKHLAKLAAEKQKETEFKNQKGAVKQC